MNHVRIVGIALLFSSVLYVGQAVSLQAKFAFKTRIVDDITGDPIEGARVVANGGRLRTQSVVKSDTTGHAAIKGLSEGYYNISVEKAGYFPLNYREISAEAPEKDFGDLVLTSKRSIFGSVQAKGGEPRMGVRVELLELRGKQWSQVLTVGPAITDSHGDFKFEGLSPRRYLVFAFRPANGGRVTLPVFYPRGDRPEVAIPLDLISNQVVSKVSLEVEEVGGVTVEGTISAANVPAGSPVQIALCIAGISSPPLISTQVVLGGAYRLSPVPPGSYLLVAKVVAQVNGPILLSPAEMAGLRGIAPTSVTRRETPEPPAEPLGMASLPADVLSTGSVQQMVLFRPETPMTATSLVVSDRPIGGLNIAIPPSAPIQGIVESEEEGSAFPRGVASQLLSFQSSTAENLGVYGTTSDGFTTQSGEFRLTGTLPGQSYVLSRGLSFPSGSYIAKITQGNRDLMAGAIGVNPGVQTVRILLKRDGGTITGKVTDRGRVLSRAFVVLAPRNRKIESWYRSAFTLGDGTFKLFDIAPGQYDLFALTDNQDDLYYDEKFLRDHMAQSVAVQILPRSARSGIDVSIIK